MVKMELISRGPFMNEGDKVTGQTEPKIVVLTQGKSKLPSITISLAVLF